MLSLTVPGQQSRKTACLLRDAEKFLVCLLKRRTPAWLSNVRLVHYTVFAVLVCLCQLFTLEPETSLHTC